MAIIQSLLISKSINFWSFSCGSSGDFIPIGLHFNDTPGRFEATDEGLKRKSPIDCPGKQLDICERVLTDR